MAEDLLCDCTDGLALDPTRRSAFASPDSITEDEDIMETSLAKRPPAQTGP